LTTSFSAVLCKFSLLAAVDVFCCVSVVMLEHAALHWGVGMGQQLKHLALHANSAEPSTK
jgi:hypothetical protein